MSPSIGSILKEARRRLGLRVKDVAARTSSRISASYLSCIENDLRLPSEDLLLELAQILGLDRREVYLELVRSKAPADIRAELFADPAPVDSRFARLRGVSLGELVERASETTENRREVLELRRELARLERRSREARRTQQHSGRWESDAARYRMSIERTSVEVAISLDGDAEVIRHVIGLEPRPGRPALVAVQHTARLPLDGASAGDQGFKLLEQPEDLAVELEQKRIGSDLAWLRIVFPEGLRHEPGKDRRISYVFRSYLRGAYHLARSGQNHSFDALGDDRGDRGSVVVMVDKPSEVLDIEVRFPTYYIPDDLKPWAGTQEIFETEDNFLDQDVCESWSFATQKDYRARLEVRRPALGMRFGITWRPLFKEEFDKVKERLEINREENRR